MLDVLTCIWVVTLEGIHIGKYTIHIHPLSRWYPRCRWQMEWPCGISGWQTWSFRPRRPCCGSPRNWGRNWTLGIVTMGHRKMTFFQVYPPENWHDNGKSPFLIGGTSWNGWFSIVRLVFIGVSLGFPQHLGVGGMTGPLKHQTSGGIWKTRV